MDKFIILIKVIIIARHHLRSSSSFSTSLNSRYAMTTLMSSLPNLRYGRSPILDAFFLLRLFSSHLALHSFTRESATVYFYSCWLINPHTSAELITSQQPSDPITINLSVSSRTMF